MDTDTAREECPDDHTAHAMSMHPDEEATDLLRGLWV